MAALPQGIIRAKERAADEIRATYRVGGKSSATNDAVLERVTSARSTGVIDGRDRWA